jgi:hypothetical protein
MNEKNFIKIQIPYLIETGLGIVLMSRLYGLFHKKNYFEITENAIFHTGSEKTFSLKEAKSILIHKTEFVPVTKNLKFDWYKPSGKEIKLFLKNDQNETVQILPSFIYSVNEIGKKDWERFINELSKATKLPVECINEKEN